MATTRPERLHFTENNEADELLAREPLALLIGFVLDQQVPVQKAFSSPLVLRSRLGELDAHAIAQMDPAELERVFRDRPALHRFPGSMAARTRELCATLADDYGGDPERIWADATDAGELERRLLALPGIGPMKAKTLMAVLAKRFGVRPPGWEEHVPRHPTLGDVDSTEALLAYQALKRAHKAARRAEAAGSQSESPSRG
jgi:uncharacterized HhH-GPD family protein